MPDGNGEFPLGRAAFMPAALLFGRYAPQAGWFTGPASGAHGYGHAARVLFWANAIGLRLIEDGVRLNLDVVRWAAVLHDCRRLHDGSDPQHGRRAAAWLTGPESPFAFSSPALSAAVAYCCEWHVPPDREAPALTPELVCLKDADSLDRVRFGTLRHSFLRTPHAHALAEAAQRLFDASAEAAADPELQWLCVRVAAQSLGLEATKLPGARLPACCFSC